MISSSADGTFSSDRITISTAFQSTKRPRKTKRGTVLSELVDEPCHTSKSIPFSTSSITLPRIPEGSARRVRSLATSTTSACFLPGSSELAKSENSLANAMAVRLSLDSELRKKAADTPFHRSADRPLLVRQGRTAARGSGVRPESADESHRSVCRRSAGARSPAGRTA